MRLFERLPGGVYQPTAAGERAAAAAERVETRPRRSAATSPAATSGCRPAAGDLVGDAGLSGWLTPAIARFRQAHPGIAVELVVDNRLLSLSRREADIALRVPALPTAICWPQARRRRLDHLCQPRPRRRAAGQGAVLRTCR